MLSFVAVFAFSNTFVFRSLTSVVSDVSPLEPIHLSAILIVFLVLVGSLQIITSREPKLGFFIFLLAILLIPSVLTTTTTNWAQILELKMEMGAELPRGAVLLLTTLTVLGYVALQFTTRENSLALSAADRGFDREEVGAAYIIKHIWGFAVITGAIAIALLIFQVSNQTERVLGENLRDIPIGVLFTGIICSLLIIMVVYSFLVQGRSPVVQISPNVGSDHIIPSHLIDDVLPSQGVNGQLKRLGEQGDLSVEKPSPSPSFCIDCGSPNLYKHGRWVTAGVPSKTTRYYEWTSQCNSCGFQWISSGSDSEHTSERD